MTNHEPGYTFVLRQHKTCRQLREGNIRRFAHLQTHRVDQNRLAAPRSEAVCVCTVLGHERRGSLQLHCYMSISSRGAAAFKQTLPNKAMLEGGGTV